VNKCKQNIVRSIAIISNAHKRGEFEFGALRTKKGWRSLAYKYTHSRFPLGVAGSEIVAMDANVSEYKCSRSSSII